MATGADFPSTNVEMIRRMGDLKQDSAWREFFSLYETGIRNICKSWQFSPQDVDELLSQISLRIVRVFASPRFQLTGYFRGFLRTLIRNEILTFLRQKQQDRHLFMENPEFFIFENILAEEADLNLHDVEKELIKQLKVLEIIIDRVKARIKDDSWKIYWEITLNDKPVKDVAQEFQLTISAVYKTESRVERILREEIRSYFDDQSRP